MLVIVMEISGLLLTVECEEEDTIGELKAKVGFTMGWETWCMRISKAYIILNDKRTLKDCDIHEKSCVRLNHDGSTDLPVYADGDRRPAQRISNQLESVLLALHQAGKTIEDALPSKKKDSDKITVYVKEVFGMVLPMECKEEDTVGELKEKVGARMGWDSKYMRIFKVKTLYKDELTLKEYYIHDESTVYVDHNGDTNWTPYFSSEYNKPRRFVPDPLASLMRYLKMKEQEDQSQGELEGDRNNLDDPFDSSVLALRLTKQGYKSQAKGKSEFKGDNNDLLSDPVGSSVPRALRLTKQGDKSRAIGRNRFMGLVSDPVDKEDMTKSITQAFRL